MTDLLGLIERLRSACLDIETGEELDSDARPDIHVDDVREIITLLTAAPDGLETTAEERVALLKLLERARPGPWVSDSERCDGSYGAGEDVHEGFDSYFVIDAQNHRVVDTLNSDGSVEVEYDEDGTHAWDEAGRESIELIVALRNQGAALLRDFDRLFAALAAEKERAEAAEARLVEVERVLRPFAQATAGLPTSVHIDPSHKRDNLPEYSQDKCPKCGGPVETGFGLAGGGYGIYSFCNACGEIVSKSEVQE